MYGGEQRLVEIRFINPLLDAVVDRFGTKDVQYDKVDETHFSVTAKVEISDQFFGWLLGFGKRQRFFSIETVAHVFHVVSVIANCNAATPLLPEILRTSQILL